MAWGQVVEISGVVKDTDGEPLPGVAVMVKGTTTGVVTQVDGTYLLQTIKPDKTTVFVFSFMGFKTEERHYDGNNSINVVMEEEVKKLDDVVVTALGIRREEKGLGYATQTVTDKMIGDATPKLPLIVSLCEAMPR